MKWHWKLCVALGMITWIIMGIGAFVNASTMGSAKNKPAYVQGEILVRFKQGTKTNQLSSLISQLGSVKAHHPHQGYQIQLPSDRSVTQVIQSLYRNSNIQWIQPNYYYYALGSCTPTNPFYVTGECSGEPPVTWFYDQIHAPQGWAEFLTCPPSGSSPITVAVLDTGVDEGHECFQGIGVSFVTGYDFINNQPIPVGDSTDDDNGHGTFVTSLIASAWNTAYGCPGVAGTVVIMPIKVLDSTGSGTTSSLVSGIDYAIQNGAQILNLSLGGAYFGTAEENAINTAIADNMIVVAAAGNSGGSLDYPAAYPPVVAVGATGPNGQVESYSNQGTNLKLVAPGGDALAGYQPTADMFGALDSAAVTSGDYSPAPCDSQFGSGSGTSFATPLVSAAFVLVWDLHPGWTNNQAINQVINTTTPIGSGGWNPQSGYGLLNLGAALAPSPTPDIYQFLKTFNDPNPFYPDAMGFTHITLFISHPESVHLTIYDSAGQIVLSREYGPDQLNNTPSENQYKSYYIGWDGKNGAGFPVVTGVYPYRVQIGSQTGMNKIVVIRGTT